MTLPPANAQHEKALAAILQWLLSNAKTMYVLKGYSGTGKTSLINNILDSLEAINATETILNPKHVNREVILSAMSGEAVNVLAQKTGREVRTIHKVLGLIPKHSYDYTSSKLILKDKAERVYDAFIIIDEISQANPEMMEFLKTRTTNCKILLVGDPAQIIDMNDDSAPAFAMGFPYSELTTVLRTDKPIITELSEMLREAVTTGTIRPFKADGEAVHLLPRPDFERKLLADIQTPSWTPKVSRLMAWRNKRVQFYNQKINQAITGEVTFKTGDYAVVNDYMQTPMCHVRNGELVLISDIQRCDDRHGLSGAMYTLQDKGTAFMPDSAVGKAAVVNQYKKTNNYKALREIGMNWLDIRHMFASTVNKAQGSTYVDSFVDIEDIGACWKPTHKARLLYVAVSRARDNVYMPIPANRNYQL